ncbi:hypothetical protein D2E25_0080 [Bifidobacterium goeldii]|uniref:Uncharacterized protein n=1 Tax=Bifidobacterium goeldii TaxID=2306975 RepID=A0A430FLK7_9BIFI|nr:DUF6350 family protein [Bifidobacterium goeldii]RSX53774.1 hypothetical protein D2E25_0080 [Bifidobacterium goeldii]
MMAKLRAWIKGPIVAVATMAIYAIALGCFLALMLLVISMEEGGDNLSVATVPLTQAVVLLSQGVGFTTDSLSLSITPLLLTFLLIALVASLARRISTDARSYVSGLVTWIVLTLLLTRGLTVGLMDNTAIIGLKSAVLFTLGFAIAALPGSPLLASLRGFIHAHVSQDVRRTVRIGVMLALIIMAVFVLAGIITVIVWIVSGHAAMSKLFDFNGMETGSRILTTIASLAWLPNLCIWAISWLFGAGFAIGDLAEFTLWIGQSRSLPAVPAFGLFPQPVSSDVVRLILVMIPLATGLIAGLAAILLKSGFHITLGSAADPVDRRALIVELAYPVGGFCLTSVIVSLSSSLMFIISNGSLGSERLKNVGVDVIRSTQVCARPSATGLFAAWLIMLVGVAFVFGIRWISRRIRAAKGVGDQKSQHSSDHDDADNRNKPRLVGGSSNVIDETKTTTTEETTKEEHDDQHESTDTTGSGVSLS